MTRRSFITKALAGVAAIPLLGKLVKSQPCKPYVSVEEADAYFAERIALPPQRMVIVRGPTRASESGYFSSAAEVRRKQMLAYVRSNGCMETTAEAVSRIFADFNHDQIDAFCEEHGLIIEARVNGMIRISMLWRMTVRNEFATL